MLRTAGHRMLCVLAVAGVLVVGSRAAAFTPVIAVPAYIDRLPRGPQPLADFRAPEPILSNRRSEPDDGVSHLKLFLSERSLLDEPTSSAVAPPAIAIGFEIPADDPSTSPTPTSIAEAVRLLKGAAPAKEAGIAPDEAVRPTSPEVRQAVAVLRTGSTQASQLPDMPQMPTDSAVVAAVDDEIAKLNASISAETLATLVVPAPMLGEEEQDAARTAVAKAAASLLGQPESAPSAPSVLPAPRVVNTTPAPLPAASCATCGRGRMGRPVHPLGGHLKGGHLGDAFTSCSGCGADWRCHPGRTPCGPCHLHEHDGPVSRFFCCFYECLCCPDPCYEPRWNQVANAALFVDGARPVTQTEVRWNGSRGGIFPDRSEYIWARADGMGRGPRPPAGVIGPIQFDFDDLVLITETASEKFSAIVELPYRAVSPDIYAHGAGFGDMAIGTKTLLYDCELMQVSMQMKTYLPVGNVGKGVGNGHVSIEPSLLFAVKMTSDCYFQGQISEWIPIGGDPFYAGSILHSHFSLNHVIHRFGPEIPLVGTFETITYSFQDGAYTDALLGPFQGSSGETYVSMGPGVRLFFCDKLDIGFGTNLAVTGDHFSREYYRLSVRMRF